MKNLQIKDVAVKREQRKNLLLPKNLVANQAKKQLVAKTKKLTQANALKEMLVVLKRVRKVLIATKKNKAVYVHIDDGISLGDFWNPRRRLRLRRSVDW